MNYLKRGLGTSQPYHEAQEMAKPMTPKSERPRATWGSIAPISLQTTPGLCGKKRPGKGSCWRKAGHEGDCP